MPKYNHAYTIAFSLESDDPEGNDVTAEMLRDALTKRMRGLDSSTDSVEWIEATGAPFDTFET
jgi:hypothetical protein